jgi:hypothetical protein
MTTTRQTLKQAILILFATSLVNGCGTVTLKPIDDNEPAFDSSTPMNYDNQNSGIVSLVRVGNLTLGAKITDHKRDQYNELISKYKLQFKEKYSVLLSKDAGVIETEDQFGNHLWQIDTEHLQYFMRLVRWQKEGVEPDSLTLKAKQFIQ